MCFKFNFFFVSYSYDIPVEHTQRQHLVSRSSWTTFVGGIPLCYKEWRKKNECFSNNCNFVYFQYKKIMSAPKQPVINSVLITYIDYSITENYIGKMA